ncbi:DPP IV N-terminal domain-containing protein [Paenibacillus profundus]|uniref:DPP IV N-terminal domain-containing protein n=1 Tax=Paenibacillus profundus TaxID=1173085 RepID=A0ABS8YMP5_9BACL|nr:DPP IV N-terminal domain-containing protein [Paenibacillus profundus]MCE5171865.1 DPP IV N-terminal domain-containing protein [Paenibacillus profundus]
MNKVMPREQYERAEQLLYTHWMKHVFNGRVVPQWVGGTNRFWYRRDVRLGTEKGTEFIVVNPANGTSKPVFDHERLASSLSAVLYKRVTPYHLPIDELEFHEDENVIRFEAAGERWECDLCSYRCAKMKPLLKPAMHELLSPDGQWAAYTEKYNLYIRHMETGEVRQLTHDGEAYYDYASEPEVSNKIARGNVQLPPAALWSPDSKKLLTQRLDQRLIRELHLVQNVPANEQDQRPVLHTQRYASPGDEHVAQADIVICDIDRQESIKVDAPRMTMGNNTLFSQLAPQAAWSLNGKQAYYMDMARDHRSAKLLVADAETGAARTAVEERSDTFLFIDLYHFGNLDIHIRVKPNFQLLQDDTVLWLSERDGWAHLYLFDSVTGQLVRQLTSGEWNVRRLVAVDECKGWIYFTAGGREAGRDPYYQHLYRIRLDGTCLNLLTPEDADHKIAFAPDLRYFIDTYSRVDQPPVSVLCEEDGGIVRELEQADIELLLEQGYQIPERFTVKARDGVTDLYGILVRPASFDPEQSYPLIDYFYGGPQLLNTPKSFIWDAALLGVDFSGGAQSLAQLGFVTIIMDGMGTPFRSKAFHDVSDGKLEEAAGLLDHAGAIRQLAERYPFIDQERVGIWGVSGGGYGSTRAMLQHSDVYKVAVSAAGNHNQLTYISMWGERFQGLVDPEHPERYATQDNAQLAGNLKGKLLLAHGDMDDNVHPAQTLRLVDALIHANKDFDLLVMPNVGHSIDRNPYFIRRKWDYFVQHLLGVEPPKEYQIKSGADDQTDLDFQEPAGPYKVGTVSYHWVDGTREETLTERPGDKRELMVQIWYPADEEMCGERQPYFPDPALYAGALNRSLQLPLHLVIQLGAILTNSVLDAPLANGKRKYPVLIYSHGFGALANSSTFLVEQLVSRGYIVLGINHTYNCSITVFPDGRIAKFKDMGSQGTKVMNKLAADVWARDVRFILDRLEGLARHDADRFAGRIDTSRIGILGHSFGGATAAQAIMQDPRLKAGLNMDGAFYGHPIPAAGLNRPFLYMYDGKAFSRDNLETLIKEYEKLGISREEAVKELTIIFGRHDHVVANGHYSLKFKSANHMSFTDFTLAVTADDSAAALAARRTHAIIHDFALDFFDHYIKGKPSSLFPGGGAGKYPEVELARGKVRC